MELDTITTILIALCPAISAAITTVIGFLTVVKTIKEIRSSNNETVKKSIEKIERIEKKLNVATLKLASLEKNLVEHKEKYRHE